MKQETASDGSGMFNGQGIGETAGYFGFRIVTFCPICRMGSFFQPFH